MHGLKTILFYVGGVLLLVIASMAATRQSDGAGFVPPTTTPAPPATATPAAALNGCTLTPATGRHGYRSGAPETDQLTPPPAFRWRDQRLIITGRVLANDCRTPLANVLIEVWHADPEGNYDRSDNFYLSGQLRTDSAGRYKITTLAPGRYRRGQVIIPAHVHLRLTMPGAAPVFTQIYFADDPYLENLPASAAELVAPVS
jgi:protocatechuate 3,4-dioxygenase beta subunit